MNVSRFLLLALIFDREANRFASLFPIERLHVAF
jgi:hypothetical protein